MPARSRLWGTAVVGVVVLVPPAVCLVVQALAVYLSANNNGYCSTQVSCIERGQLPLPCVSRRGACPPSSQPGRA